MQIYQFFKNLIPQRQIRKQELQPTINRAADYAENFKQALQFTRDCGFKPVDKVLGGVDVIDAKGELIERVCRDAGVEDASASAGQCLKWCHYLQPFFERTLQRTVWVTIGQLWKGDRHLFNPSFGELKRWTANGIQIDDFAEKTGLNLHAWLTVDTGEIIDPTFLSSMAAVQSVYEEFNGMVAWGRDRFVLINHQYCPMLVGQEAAEAIGEKSVLSLLAKNSEELHSVTALVYAA